MKVAVIYDSKTGTTAKAAQFIADGIEQEAVEAVCFKLEDSDCDFVRNADGIIIGCPTYMASATAEMMTWLQTKAGGLGFAHKLGGAFATEQYIHGGAENVLTTILTNEMVFGMMTYSGGGSYGKPVIHLGPVGMSQDIESFRALFTTYGTRFAQQLNR